MICELCEILKYQYWQEYELHTLIPVTFNGGVLLVVVLVELPDCDDNLREAED